MKHAIAFVILIVFSVGAWANTCKYEVPHLQKLQIGVGGWAPWTVIDGNGLSGWEVEYVNEIMKEMNVKKEHYEVNPLNWGSGCCENKTINGELVAVYPKNSEHFSSVYDGVVDFAMSVTSNSDRRVLPKMLTSYDPVSGRPIIEEGFVTSERYGFLLSFVTFSYLKKRQGEFDFSVKGLEMLRGKKVVVQGRGSNQDHYLKLVSKEKKIPFEIVYVKDLAAAQLRAETEALADNELQVTKKLNPNKVADPVINALLNGKVDLLFGSTSKELKNETRIVSKGSVKDQDKERFERVWGTGAVAYFSPKGDKKLVDAFNCAVSKISHRKSNASGEDFYDKLKAKYNMGLCNPTNTEAECAAFMAK